jgi:hypothetical protein
MPQEKRFESPAERQRAYRERKARELVDPDLPVVQLDEEPEEPESLSGPRSIFVLLELDPREPLSDEEEQLVRDKFRYGASETRSRAERYATAERIAAWVERNRK